MKIECKLQRKGGTFVELPGQTYHFAPQEDGAHVADVTIEAHVERLLSIPEAYRLVRTHGADVAEAVFTPQQDDNGPDTAASDGVLLGSSTHPASFEIGGRTYSIGEIVARAHADSGVTAEDWNELDDDTRATKIDIVLDGIEDGEIVIEQVQSPEPELTRAQLIELYVAKFGKRPSNATSIENIKAKLAEAE